VGLDGGLVATMLTLYRTSSRRPIYVRWRLTAAQYMLNCLTRPNEMIVFADCSPSSDVMVPTTGREIERSGDR